MLVSCSIRYALKQVVFKLHLYARTCFGAVSVVESVMLLILVTVRHGKHGRFSTASAAFLEVRRALCGSVEVVEFLKRDLLECFATFDHGNENSFEST